MSKNAYCEVWRELTGRGAALPARVAAEMRSVQANSEYWVALGQLGVVLLLTLFYCLAPASYSPDAPVCAAPLGLAVFSALIVLRLWFAHTDQLTPLVLAASVLAEVTVLLAINWAYIPQFETTLAVALKNTLYVYLFVLIAFRALRFEPQWVLLAGIASIAGWCILTARAWLESLPMERTWDFVSYASSPRMHLGAEFDKVLALALVTLSLATALARARLTLSHALTEQHAVRNLSQFFDHDVATQITDAQMDFVPGQGVQREAAILFTDLRGFTKASAILEPSELMMLLGEYQDVVVSVIRKHGGSIDKFMGDGVLASFGAVNESATYARDAVLAVDELQEAARQWAKARQERGQMGVSIGAGLAAGPVVFGVIGSHERLEYTVISETVNLAAKLEKHNKAESCSALTTLTTWNLAEQQGYQGVMDGVDIRGLDQRTVGGVADLLNLVAWGVRN